MGRLPVERPGHGGVPEQGLRLRGEEQEAITVPVVERLLAQAVTGEEERAACAVPDSEGEHAAEMLNAPLAVLGVRAENHLGVAPPTEPPTPRLHRAPGRAQVVNPPGS